MNLSLEKIILVLLKINLVMKTKIQSIYRKTSKRYSVILNQIYLRFIEKRI